MYVANPYIKNGIRWKLTGLAVKGALWYSPESYIQASKGGMRNAAV